MCIAHAVGLAIVVELLTLSTVTDHPNTFSIFEASDRANDDGEEHVFLQHHVQCAATAGHLAR